MQRFCFAHLALLPQLVALCAPVVGSGLVPDSSDAGDHCRLAVLQSACLFGDALPARNLCSKVKWRGSLPMSVTYLLNYYLRVEYTRRHLITPLRLPAQGQGPSCGFITALAIIS